MFKIQPLTYYMCIYSSIRLLGRIFQFLLS